MRTFHWADLEQQILKCWDICEDLKIVAEQHEDNDELCNVILGLKHVYNNRFEKLWRNYELAMSEKYQEIRDAKAGQRED